MQLKVIQEDSIHGYPLDAVLVVSPKLNESMDTIYFSVYENEAKYQLYLSGSLNTDFNNVKRGYEYIPDTLRSRIIGELPTGSIAVFPHLMSIYYSELLALPRYSESFWQLENPV